MKLNVATTIFDNSSYKIYQIEFESKAQLQILRDKYNSTNSFFRFGEHIFHSPTVADNFFEGGQLVIKSTQVDKEVTKNLMHHIIFKYILNEKRAFTEFMSIKFFSIDSEKREQNDLVYNKLTQEQRSKIGYWRGYKVDTRIIDSNLEPSYCVIFNIFYEWKIKVSCQELKNNQIDLFGRMVTIKDKKSDLFYTNKVVGELIEIRDSDADVEMRGEVCTYQLKDLFLENSYDNRQILLEHVVGKPKAKSISKFLRDTSAERKGAKENSRLIDLLHNHFKGHHFSNHHGFSFKLSNLITKNAVTKWKSISIEPPLYVFNNYRNQTHKYNDFGLKTYGPHSKEYFTNPKPNIFAICRTSSQGDMSKFLGKFTHGLKIGDGKFEPYEQGFIRKYALDNQTPTPKIYTVANEEIKEYKKTLMRMLEENDKIDFVFIETCEEYKMKNSSDNPYYFTKANLLQEGIPSQGVLHKNILKNDRSVAFTLNNISLASYSKMGGKPWVMPSEVNVEHEIVIGIGNKIFKKDRFSATSRVVGITTVFSGDGDYQLSNSSKDVPFEDYLEELARSLALNIDKVSKKYSWRKGDTVRIIFHVFKPFRYDEIDYIEKVVDDLQKDFIVEFAYVTVAQSHPYLIFDENQKGVIDFLNGGKKGIWQPDRTTNLKIDDYNFLLQLTGPKELKTSKHGISAPVLVKLHEKSTFKSIEYLTRQIYKFSCISWRGFNLSSKPVTIQYSNLIAGKMGNFRSVEGWNPLNLSKVNDKTWFL